MTQMPPLFAPSRAAWEEAAAAGLAEGGRPARPARGKRRHLLFPRSFPAAPSETQPAGRPPPLARALAAPPGDRVAGAGPAAVPRHPRGPPPMPGQGRGAGAGAGAGPSRVAQEPGPPRPSCPETPGQEAERRGGLGQGRNGPRGRGERKHPHPRLPCATSRPGGPSGRGAMPAHNPASFEVGPGSGNGPQL